MRSYIEPRPPRSVAAQECETIAAWWHATVAAHAQRDAVREHGRSITYQQLDARAAHMARGLLAAGLGKGARVGLLFPNGSDWIASWLAVSRIGGIAVCLSTFFSAPELAYALRHADIAVLLTAERYLRHDYCARLLDCLPALANADGGVPLVAPEMPHLRAIWANGPTAPSWARGTLNDLEALGAGADDFSNDLLLAVEASTSPADQAVMIFTSGTTADPKAVVHTQGAIVDKFLYMAEIDTLMPLDMKPGDRPLITSPLFWVGGLITMGGALTIGATIICEDDHSPRAIVDRMRSEKVTHLHAWKALGADGVLPGEFDSVKPMTSPQLAFTHIVEDIPPSRFSNSLGMTETIGPHSGFPGGGQLPIGKDGAFGRALPGMEFKIVDPATGVSLPAGMAGELYVRGRWLMDGFYKRRRSEIFEKDGFYATGDNCTLDEDGYLFFHGRLSAMIKTSGANVSPEEVEGPLKSHPDVIDAVVIGVPDPKLDQMVVAVVTKAEQSSLSEADLQHFLRSRLSSFKVPKRIVFMASEDLPKTPTGKVRKSMLVDMLVGGSKPRGAASDSA